VCVRADDRAAREQVFFCVCLLMHVCTRTCVRVHTYMCACVCVCVCSVCVCVCVCVCFCMYVMSVLFSCARVCTPLIYAYMNLYAIFLKFVLIYFKCTDVCTSLIYVYTYVCDLCVYTHTQTHTHTHRRCIGSTSFQRKSPRSRARLPRATSPASALCCQ
jgi:hypothetical protein